MMMRSAIFRCLDSNPGCSAILGKRRNAISQARSDYRTGSRAYGYRLHASRQATHHQRPLLTKHGTIRIDPPNGKAAGELLLNNAGEDSSQALRDAVSKNAEVFNLVDVKVATQGHITWAAKPEAPAITVLAPPLTRVSTHPGL
jgi:hypothetical protein